LIVAHLVSKNFPPFIESGDLRNSIYSMSSQTLSLISSLLLSFQLHSGFHSVFLTRWGSLRDGDHWGDPDIDGRIVLRGIFRKWEGVVGTGWSGLRIRTGGGHL
jgi:hypothetical protein